MNEIRKYSASAWGVPLESRSDDFSSLLEENLGLLGYDCAKNSTTDFEWFTIEPNPLEVLRQFLGKTHYKVLIVLEPRAVSPLLYRKTVRRLYETVFVQSRRQIVLKTDQTWGMGHLPGYEVLLEQVKVSDEFQTSKNSVGLINENKFSMVPGERYSTRRLALCHLANRKVNVAVAGKHWTMSWLWSFRQALKSWIWSLISLQVPNWNGMVSLGVRKLPGVTFLGQVDSQISFHREHPVALVIENDLSYVSEKLFNALLAGSTPVYVGPPLADFEIPSNVAVECAPDPIAISKAVQIAMSTFGKEIGAAGRLWIASKEAHSRWSKTAGAADLANKLVQDLMLASRRISR